MEENIMYDITKGYGLQLTKFDEQYQDTIIYRQSKQEVIELADKILRTFGHEGLLGRLNEMQHHACYYNADDNYVECELFLDKFEIPAYFINLILSEYGMSVRGWEDDIPKVYRRCGK